MPQLRSDQISVMTLIFTPETVGEFGRKLRPAVAHSRVKVLYEDALDRSFRPVSRAKSVPEFKERWKRGSIRYWETLEEMLELLLSELGPSGFRLAYLRQISAISKRFEELPFGVHDLSGLLRRHLACSTNLASNYEALFASYKNRAERATSLLRSTNYGITFLYLNLSRNLTSPSWVFLEANDRVLAAIKDCESTLAGYESDYQLAGSLKISDQELDLFESEEEN